MQILNNRATLKYSFTLIERPMEVYTVKINLDQSIRQGDGAIGLSAGNPTSVVIKKGENMLLNRSIFRGGFEAAEKIIDDWVTHQEFLIKARNGDAD